MSGYSTFLKSIHWLQALGTIGVFATVQLAINTEDKKLKKDYMLYHKSLALGVIAITPLRLFARFTSPIPPPLPGSFYEQMAGKAAHYAMYVTMCSMPITGLMMGYYSGFGVPFFNYFTILKNKENADKEKSKLAFNIHKNVGQAYEYLFLAHLAGTAYHLSKGQAILSRMLFK